MEAVVIMDTIVFPDCQQAEPTANISGEKPIMQLQMRHAVTRLGAFMQAGVQCCTAVLALGSM